METHKTIKRLKLVAAVLVTALALTAQLRSVIATQDQPARLFEIVGISVPLEARVAADDGVAFVVHFAGDTRGSLDTCG